MLRIIDRAKRIVLCAFWFSAINCINFAIASEGHHGRSVKCMTESEESVSKANPMYAIGGQERARGDFVRNQNLGDFSFISDTRDEQLLSRTRLNLSLHPVKPLEAFVQGQFYMRKNHSDYSKLNLYQAYLDFSNTERFTLGFKIGRQELCYGSAFFLGANDFYDGLVWDTAKLRITPQDKLWIDLIGARYVKLDKHTSDNEPELYGAYSSYEITHDTAIDLYFFYHKGGFKFFHTDLPDGQKWFTLGARLAGKIKDKFDFEIEPLYQFGKIGNPERSSRDTISAYGGHIEAGYSIDSKYNPRFFTAYAHGSGDNNIQDKKYREFHGNIYNDNYLVGDTSLIPDLSGIAVGGARASGMHILVAGLSLDLTPKLNLNLDNHYFLADKTPAGISRLFGDEINLIAAYKPFETLNIIAGANRFFSGKLFEDAAGSKKPVDYFYIQTQIEF